LNNQVISGNLYTSPKLLPVFTIFPSEIKLPSILWTAALDNPVSERNLRFNRFGLW